MMRVGRARRRLRLDGWHAVAGAAIFVMLQQPACAKDIELGRYLASECHACHRTGAAGVAIPNIYGMPENKLAEAVKSYRDKRRPNEVMQNVASRLKDDEIEAHAAYFATAKRP